jgi:hypothetical protein
MPVGIKTPHADLNEGENGHQREKQDDNPHLKPDKTPINPFQDFHKKATLGQK